MQFLFREHITCEENQLPDLQKFQDEHPLALTGQPDYMGQPKHLGIDEDLVASYYIGADWLVPGESSVVVLPKMDNIDFIGMFLEALSVDSAAEVDYFSHCYGISFNEPLIEAPDKLNQLSPLLLIHYITLLEKLLKQGLKKDYITIEDNLKGKVKGHLMMAAQLRKNIIQKREDRAYCRYQEYTEDIPANRLLKRALLFAQQMLLSIPSLKGKDALQIRLNVLLARFEHISDQVSISEVHNIGGNKLYRHYTDAVRVAKDILRRYGYSIAEVGSEGHFTPPFWIDMSRLFELYVYSKLNAAYPGQIGFQAPGYQKTAADYVFVPEEGQMPLVIDAKYKPRYDSGQSGILPDIREISGYARDNKILWAIGINPDAERIPEVGCLIIYPTGVLQDIRVEGLSETEMHEWQDLQTDNEAPFAKDFWAAAKPIHGFRNFRKINIPLPIMNSPSGE